ncbi:MULTISPECIES: TerB family tellurite resistance protein [Roseateles]|uniref:TerB family tellurite resistance protein n=1 Tax=Roseateles albus TaxID=2987525 RepID=A0ABT5KDH6_9BURK|nr:MULTISPECIES: TerB family tellurite resistance protein [Roseateles]MCV2360312.1 TerB family tellurite resistance protein [Paucibacter sp. TC2R-5]MDC8771978.1 TerB family tellurite resistance protein [Roseateles albus]
MRSYPRNSAEAAARIVALVLIADGNVSLSEFNALQQLDAAGQLGLAPGGLGPIVQSLCEDLLVNAYGSASMMSSVDEQSMAALMAEVDEPLLQRKVLTLALAAARADAHLAEGETLVLEAACRHWQIHLGDAQAA